MGWSWEAKYWNVLLDWMIFSSDLMMGKEELRRLRLNNYIGEEFQMEWNKLRFVLIKRKTVKEYRHRTRHRIRIKIWEPNVKCVIPTWQAAVSSPPHCWRSSRTFEPPPEHSLPFKRFPHFQKISTGSGTWLTRSQYSRSNPALSSSSLLKEDVKKNSRMTASSITALIILNAAKISRSDSKLLLMTLRWLNDFSENIL